MDASNEWSCAKCGSKDYRKRNLRLRGELGAGIIDSEQVTAYFCDKCGYVELYAGKR